MSERYYSQFGQDKWIIKIFKNKTDGFYVDIGANDGMTFSNTKKLEELGWKGICVEPDPEVFEKLDNIRKSDNYNIAIGDKEGEGEFTKITGKSQMLSGLSDKYEDEHIERIQREINQNKGKIEKIRVEIHTFDWLFVRYPDIRTIDFLSVDTEGGEESIIKSIDFNSYTINTIAVENNYKDDSIRRILTERGYDYLKCKGDDIFILRSFYRITVTDRIINFCERVADKLYRMLH